MDHDRPASELIRRERAAGRDWRRAIPRRGGPTGSVGPGPGLVLIGHTAGGAALAVPAAVAAALAVCRSGCPRYEPGDTYGRCGLIDGCCGRFLAELQRGRLPDGCPQRDRPGGRSGADRGA